jgi:prepilin-type N-terminal cleavage/methylation domain-containing protein
MKILNLKSLNLNLKSTDGFTFVELIVVLGIFSAIAGIILFNYRDFSSTISLRNLAQDIALQVSGAQRKAVAGTRQPLNVLTNPCLNTSGWIPSYGSYFNTEDEDLDGVSGNSFRSFVDANCDNWISDTNGNESSDDDLVTITGGDVISQICLNEDTNSTCSLEASELSVVFRRPNVGAIMSDNSNGPTVPISDARIIIESGDGKQKSIIIRASGQIITR